MKRDIHDILADMVFCQFDINKAASQDERYHYEEVLEQLKQELKEMIKDD